MTWDPEADILFPHTVTLTAPGAVNSYGRKTAGTGPIERAALVEHKVRAIRKIDGTETASGVTVYLSGSGGVTGVTTDWTVVLPDDTSRPIVSVDRFADETGDLLEVIHLQ